MGALPPTEELSLLGRQVMGSCLQCQGLVLRDWHLVGGEPLFLTGLLSAVQVPLGLALGRSPVGLLLF